MKPNKVQFKNIKGIKKDIVCSSLSNEYAYDMRNLRITPITEENMFGVINEKGNKSVFTDLAGTPIGQCIIGDYMVVFSHTTTEDYIHIFYYDKETLELKKETKSLIGLELDTRYPLETLGFYENEDVQKVYWTDGIHQLRVLNIKELLNSETGDSIIVDAIPDVNALSTSNITITKNSTGGYFKSGTIQYFLTMQKENGQESNIFYLSPIYYISDSDRGTSPNETCSCSFEIKISNILDTLSIEYGKINIYSIYHSSLNISEVKLLETLNVQDDITFIDNGLKGATLSDQAALYIGGEPFSAETLAQKANKLFLGNITLLRSEFTSEEKALYKTDNENTVWTNAGFKLNTDVKKIEHPETQGLYPYERQLNKPNESITTFKYNEHYRFGVQVQANSGKWSNPIWIGDFTNDLYPKSEKFYNNSDTALPYFEATLSNEELRRLSGNNYQAIRPVVVFPEIQDRKVVAQGLVCPTVFNLKSRCENTIYAQSSWFIRPIAPVSDSFKDNYYNFETGAKGMDSPGGLLHVDNSEGLDGTSKMSYCEYRHYYPLANRFSRNSEIQTDSFENLTIYKKDDELPLKTASDNPSAFFVDQSIVTFHSPELEFNTDLIHYDLQKCKFRITGIVPITASAGSIDMWTQNLNDPNQATGYGIEQHEKIIFNTDNKFGFRNIYATPRWRYNAYNLYMLYPWQDYIDSEEKNGDTTQHLKQKYMSHLFFSNKSVYLNNAGILDMDSSDIKVFNSLQDTLLKIDTDINTTGQTTINYYGNINNQTFFKNVSMLITSPRDTSSYNGTVIEDERGGKIIERNCGINMTYKSTNHAVIALKGFNSSSKDYLSQIILPGLEQTIDNSTDRTNPHEAGFSLNTVLWRDSYSDYRHLNRIMQPSISVEDFGSELIREDIGRKDDFVSPLCGHLWLGEIYNNDVKDPFGGTSEEAIISNNWLVAGPSIVFNQAEGNVVVKWLEGDTYYQRYDHLKTYPYTEEDKNQNTEVVSFMVETHINIDGTYDLNHGLEDNSTVRPENFNRLNSVYSQQNNYFIGKTTEDKNAELNHFPNTITWSETKVAGEKKDSWTKLNVLSSVDVDGTYGSVNKLINFNDTLIAFQDNALSKIPYQEREQISTESGEPIEIQNSSTVGTPQLLFNNIGCVNKWSVCTTPTNLYFIDDFNKSIYTFEKGVPSSLTDLKGFKSWINKELPEYPCKWNPINANNFVTYNDVITNDVYFIKNNTCLAYNEMLAEFTSFYSYENTPYMSNFSNRFFAVKNNSLWLQHEGDYNSFYDEMKPFSISVYVNNDSHIDKSFNTIDFRSETWTKDEINLINETDWEYLHASTEYQEGENKLNVTLVPTNTPLRRKYRMWAANIPRNNFSEDMRKKMDRIRNPWALLTLSSERDEELITTNKTILHDIIVNVTEF